MSRTNVRKHPQKSTVNSATKAGTNTTGPDCNAAVITAKTEDPRLPAASTGTATGQRPSPCSTTQSIKPRVLSPQRKISHPIRDNNTLAHDLRPMNLNLPPRLAALKLQEGMTSNPTIGHRPGARRQAASTEICRSFQAGRCRHSRCRWLHITKEEAANRLSQSPDTLPAHSRVETNSQTASSGQSTVPPSRQPMGPSQATNIPMVDTSAKHTAQSDVTSKASKPPVSSSTSPSQPIVTTAAAPPPQSTGKQGTPQKAKADDDTSSKSSKRGRQPGQRGKRESKDPPTQTTSVTPTPPSQPESSGTDSGNVTRESPDKNRSLSSQEVAQPAPRVPLTEPISVEEPLLPSKCAPNVPRTEPTSSEDPLPPREVCYNFFRDRCRYGLRCHRYHPPRYMWKEFLPKSDETCVAFLEGRCWLGEHCWMYHPPSEDSESSDESPEEPTPAPKKSASKRKKKTRENSHKNDRNPVPMDDPKVDSGPSTGGSAKALAKSTSRPTTSARGKRKQLEPEHTDGCSSDVTTYFSAASSSPGTSPSAAPRGLPPSASSKTRAKRPVSPCIDFRKGRCQRKNCRYSHGSELDRIMNLLQDSAARPKEDTAVEKSVVTQNSNPPERTDIPLLPPGLGLEKTVPAPPQPPPESRTLLVESSQVTFGPGFEVTQVQTGFESRKILLKEIPTKIGETAIRDILTPFGSVQEIQLPERRNEMPTMLVRAAFSSYTEAIHAVAALDGAHVFGANIVAQLATHKTSVGKGFVSDSDALLEFPAPCITGYLGFSTPELADQAVQQIRGTVECNVRLHAERYDGLPKAGSYNVKVLGLPPKTQIEDLARFGHDQGGMLDAAFTYESLKQAGYELQNLLERFGELVSINIQDPPYSYQMIRAWAHFTTPDAAENACKALNGRRWRFCGNSRVSAHHVRSVHYKLPTNVFAVIERDILTLRSRVCSRSRYDDIVIIRRRENPDAPVSVKLLGEVLPDLTKLKQAFEEILRGERLLENGEPLWDPFFNHAFSLSFLQELEKRYDMLINRDHRRRIIALFGSPKKRQAARAAILAKIQYLRSQKNHKFSLEGRLIGLFMSEDLMKLQKSLGRENVEIDMARRMLIVRGDEAAFTIAEDIIRKVQLRHVLERTKRGNECPVCFSEATLPVTLPCGHTWCKTCLVNYCKAAIDTRVFPLKCLGNEARCTQCIPLQTAFQVLLPNQYSDVARAAFLAYVQARPKEFHYCPTPDCPQIYRTAPPDTALQCPSCLVRICGNCHVEYHEGSFCPDRDAEDRSLFEKWAQGRDVKKCPGCKAPIERIAGCNHMTCTRCRTHICWVCLATFTASKDVYDHMHGMHGGIGL